MHVGNYLRLVHAAEQELAGALTTVAHQHQEEPDVKESATLLADWSQEHISALAPLLERYDAQRSAEPERLTQALFQGPRTGSLALLRDLHDLFLLASSVQISWLVLSQAALALRDRQLEELCRRCSTENTRQLQYVRTRLAQAAPQALVVAS